MGGKRILLVQDISCVGRCSMTVALPILSAWGQETCILPTAVLSTHTGGFGTPAVAHLSEAIPRIREHWQREGITFDMICTGYLGSAQAAREVLALTALLNPGGQLIVDPAMADHGKVYAGLDASCVEAMLALCARADILLPNVTEAAMLTGATYRDDLTPDYVAQLLAGIPCSRVILTGVSYNPDQSGVEIKDGTQTSGYRHRKVGKNRHGTGDIFAACFAGAWAKGRSLQSAARIAANFTFKCLEITPDTDPARYGVRFEAVLPEITKMAAI